MFSAYFETKEEWLAYVNGPISREELRGVAGEARGSAPFLRFTVSHQGRQWFEVLAMREADGRRFLKRSYPGASVSICGGV